MDGTFACPDCENEIVVEGLSPGRQVRCEWCETWVEVPFIPRSPLALRRRSGLSAARRWRTWAWRGVGIAAILVGLIGTGRYLERQNCEQIEGDLRTHISAAERLENSGQFDEALLELDSALATLTKIGPEHRDQLSPLRNHRDQLLRRTVERQLEVMPAHSAEKAVASLQSLRTRVRVEPTLAELEETIDAQLEGSRRKWAESDTVAAKRAVDSGKSALAFDLCERLVKTADGLNDNEVRQRLRAEADTLVRGLISRQGVVLESTQGDFTLGSPSAYDNLFRPLLDDLLSRQGYTMRRPSSEWNGLWDSLAPYRLKVVVIERHGGNYLDSENRLSDIEARITLTRTGKLIWNGGPAIGRSQSPLPKLAAYHASQFAIGQRRKDAERLLYENARSAFAEKFSAAVRGLPACSTSPALARIP